MFARIHSSPGAGFDCQCQLGAAGVHGPSSPDSAFSLVVVSPCALGPPFLPPGALQSVEASALVLSEAPVSYCSEAGLWIL